MGGKHILFVGDDPTDGKLTQDLIAKGNDVATAQHVGEALRCIERSRPSLAFVSVDRREEIEQLARGLRERSIVLPIVLLSPKAEARCWAEEFGASAFAPHPTRLEGGICENLEAA